MGYISDNTRTRWGRRRPYIFAGAIASGITFALLWSLPDGRSESFYFWYFLIGSIVFYLAYTVFATPWVALGYELTPDYHERTRLMGVQNFMGQLAYVVAPWFLLFMQNEAIFDDMVEGAAGLSYIIAILVIAVGVLPALFLKERFRDLAVAEGREHRVAETGSALMRNLAGFFRGFAVTLRSKPFVKLCVATFLVFNGFIMVSSFQSYVISGDIARGAEYAGWAGTVQSIATFGVIALATWLGTRIGKKRTFYVAIGVSMLGYALKWVCYNPEIPWLVVVPAPLLAFGLGGLFTIMTSMIADVVDLDELQTHERREGMYGSIFWWVVKLGMAAALAAGGFMLNATGFDVALAGNQSERAITLMRLFDAFVPFVASGVAIWAIATFSITEERAHVVRMQLEARRGKV
jgi:GPH family glycoside/pentoside/hexuronide:cation symporter